MVGACLALGCAKQGKKVAMIEANQPRAFSPEQGPDIRLSAISAGTIKLLEELGAWQHILAMRSKPLLGLSVWEQAESRTDFHASELGADYIGHMVENRVVQLGLYQALVKYDNVTWIEPHRVNKIEQGEQVQLHFAGAEILTSRILIGADGVNSEVRRLVNIGTSGWQYAQQALGILIDCGQESPAVTWQQFHPSGPRAFLPMYANYASLVWYDGKERINELQGLSTGKLKEQITAAFPPELGHIEVLSCAAFPLQRLHAASYFSHRVAIIGDAAHCINPLAGQGVNLGFKDVRVLLEQLEQLDDFSAQAVTAAFSAYQRKRMPDNLLMMSSMDLLYKGFSNTIAPLRGLRNLGLKLANSNTFAKKQAMKYAMGI